MVQAHLVQVVIARPIDRLFTYQIPEALLGQIQCGDLLLVPFGKKSLLACVIELQTSHDLDQSTSVKLIQLHLPHLPQFPKALIQLMKQMAHYYHCSLGEVFKMMMPHVSVQKRMVWNHQELKSTPPSQAVKVLSEVIAYHPFTYDDLPIAISKKERQIWLANHWCQAHQIPDTPKKSFLLSVKRPALVSKSKKLSIACHIYIEHQQKVTFEQVVQHFHDRKKTSIKKALKELFDADLLELVLQSNDHHTVITNHLIVDVSDEETEEKSSQLIPSSSSSSSNPSSSSTSLIEPTKKLHGAYVQLNHEQRMVFEQMKNQNGYQCYLLYGITGSGKTEVYLSISPFDS